MGTINSMRGDDNSMRGDVNSMRGDVDTTRGGRLVGLVLGGGAIGGGSWLWRQLEERARQRGEDPIRSADHIVATSAGAAVAALWAGGKIAGFTEAVEVVAELTSKTPRLGRLDLANGLKGAVTSGVIAAETLAEHFEPYLGDWPENLTICVWDVEAWQRRTLSRRSAVPYALAVAASCAVPPVIASARIPQQGRNGSAQALTASDAGISTNTSADIAAQRPEGHEDNKPWEGAGHVDIYDPLGRLPRLPAPWEAAIWTQHQTQRRREQAALQAAGWTSVHITPTADEAAAIWRRPWKALKAA